jgi:hypothetical protein
MLTEVLDLSENKIKAFPTTCDTAFQKNVTDRRSRFPYLSELRLNDNQISEINEVCLPNLEFLDLKGNKLDRVLGRIKSVEEINPCFNLPVNVVPNSCFDTPKLVHLDVSDNTVAFGSYAVSNTWFRICSGIEELYLSENDFTAMTERQFIELFGQLRALRELFLSHTHISRLTAAMMKPFVKLTILKLGKNAIRTIPDGCFSPLVNLRELDLSYNALTTISENTFDQETKKRLFRINLNFNPLICTCDLLNFRDWYLGEQLRGERTFVPDINREGFGYRCTTSDDTSIDLEDFRMANQACILSREVSKMIITAVTLFLCLLTAVIALFQYRWHIRLFMYEAFRGKGNARRRYLDEGHFEYDVFVSYDSEQQPWILRHLKPRLERGLGLRLCLHYRDFIPGKNIVDNIVHCVESSKKILMVFSNDFVRSQWCQFELAYCLSHVMDYEDSLIVMCLDDVASREPTAAMRALMMTTNYIQYEQGRDGENLFWWRIRLALREIIVRQQPRQAQLEHVVEDVL